MKLSVITSRTAQKDYDRIKAEHDFLLKGIQSQRARVDAYNQQQDMLSREQQEKETQMSFEKEKLSKEQQFKDQDYEIQLLNALN